MRSICSATIIFVVLTSLACANRPLSNKRAQAALNQWIANKGGSVEVMGVQEFPQQSNARADLKISDLPVRDAIFGRADTYSGSGTATFTHYTDGRWVLTEVAIPYQISTWWKDINLEVR